MIKLTSKSGFIAIIDPDKITSYGIDPLADGRVWVICDGKEYSSSDNIQGQFKNIDGVIKEFNGSKKVKGF